MAFFPFVLSGQGASGVENDIDLACLFHDAVDVLVDGGRERQIAAACASPPSAVIPFATASTLDLVFEC